MLTAISRQHLWTWPYLSPACGTLAAVVMTLCAVLTAGAGAPQPGPQAPQPPAPKFYTELSPICALLNGATGSEWLNFGLWGRGGMAYPEAAEALADAVSEAAGVEAYDEVLEVGGGRGDNALRLLRHFGASRVLGVNLSPTETDAARQRIETAGLAKQALVLQGDASNLLDVVTPASVDRVVAVDCAYHFLTRGSFLQSGYAALRAGGSLAVADVVIAAGTDTLATRAAGWLFGIPRENLRTATELKSDFSAAGFHRVSVQDTTDEVFAGFAKYMQILAERRSGLDTVAPLLVGLVMGLLARSGIFRYVIVSGFVQRTEAPWSESLAPSSSS